MEIVFNINVNRNYELFYLETVLSLWYNIKKGEVGR